jgi:acylpyruvate hydrolase
MKLATIRDGGSTKAVRIDGDQAVELGLPDVGAVLARDDWQSWAAAADGSRRAVDGIEYAPLILRPDKVLCVGLNYRSHILETGNQVPTHPTLFSKFTSALIGANDDVVMPPESEKVDWEAELTVVIGREARGIDAGNALEHVAGYTVANDTSMRDWQMRTLQWLQGKNFEASTPVGPVMVTPDEIDHASDLRISCTVNDEVVQDSRTSDLIFPPDHLIAYISTFTTLRPGDLILTGTPAGVGHARTPPRFIGPDDVVVVAVEGIGECRNRFVKAAS